MYVLYMYADYYVYHPDTVLGAHSFRSGAASALLAPATIARVRPEYTRAPNLPNNIIPTKIA